MLHSCITDGFTVEKKYQHQFYIPAENSPKIVLCSNMILTAGGTTNIRRQFILEFGDYYSQHIITGAEEPIKEIHGGLFFDKEDWDEAEWNKFFNFMITCSNFYHANGLRPYTRNGQERGRLIQSTSREFVSWVNQRNLQAGEEYDNNTLYEEYCEFADENRALFPQRRFTSWIGIYAGLRDWDVVSRASNGRRYSRFVPK